MGTLFRKRPAQAADVGEFPGNHERSRNGSQKKSGSALKRERAGGRSGSTGPPWRSSNDGGRMVTRTRTPGSLWTSSVRPLLYGGDAGGTYSLPRSVPRQRVPGLDPNAERSSGNGANSRQNSIYNQVFFETGRFNREKTVQFSSVLFVTKRGRDNWSYKAPGAAGA